MIQYTRDDLYITPEIVGLAQTLSPFLACVSSGRNKLFCKHLDQALIVEGAQLPQIYTGREFDLGQYELNTYECKYDRRVLAVIPRYSILAGQFHIKESPSITVIYAIDETKQIGFFDLDNYTLGSNGFGYENIKMNYKVLEKNAYIPRDMKFQTSPIHKGNAYCFGLNANVAIMNHPDVVEDAMVVSQDYAEHNLVSHAVETLTIDVQEDQYPVDLYGDGITAKLFPDIGEFVRPDGYVCALRKSNKYTIISDTYGSSAYTPRMQDEKFVIPPGSRILDVEVNLGRNNKVTQPMFAQAEHYAQLAYQYYKKIYKAYIETSRTMSDYSLTPAMHTKVTTAMKRLVVAGDRIPGVEARSRLSLADKDRPIRFMQIKLTYIAPRSVKMGGFKLTNRLGGTHSNVSCPVYQ